MGIGWNLPTENLYQTLAGFFSPNRIPATFIETSMPTEVIFAHETEHRSLCMATTVGKYQSALADAALRRKNNQESCEQACRDLVDLCWYTHEGVATAIHTFKAIELRGFNNANDLNALLPIPYRNALNRFLNIISKERLECRRPSNVDNDTWEVGVNSIFKEAFRILALAAMSTPIAKIIEEQRTLPSHAVLVAVRRDAPDTRLLTLVNHITDEFILRCYEVMQDAHKSAMVALQSEPVDAARIELARGLCKTSNVSFEECYAIDDIAMFKKMGVSGIKIIDGRKTNLEHRLIMDSISVAVQADYEMLLPIKMDSALNLHSHAFDQQYKTQPDIICEVLAVPGEENALVEIHCFCNKIQIERIIENETHASKKSQKKGRIHSDDDNSAFLLLRYSTQVSYNSLYELPHHLVCNSFSWFIPEPFKQKNDAQSKGIDIAQLKTLGAVYVPAVEASLWVTIFESIKTIAERPERVGPEIKITIGNEREWGQTRLFLLLRSTHTFRSGAPLPQGKTGPSLSQSHIEL